MNKTTTEDRKICLECDFAFNPECEEQEFCSEDCDEEHNQINNGWRSSNYEHKDIGDWTVDDHLAAWYDDMMEK